MKKVLLLAVIALAMNIVAFGQSSMTVKDYFLKIPNEFLKADAAKRTAWIEAEATEEGYLSFNIPVKEITGEDGEGKVFGSFQVFEKSDNGILLGMATNLCEEGVCQGQILFLDYKAGKFTDVSEEYILQPDNDEVIKTLREAPAFENKDSLKDGEQVPLYINFGSTDKTVQFSAGGNNGDGGVVAKMFKWNGEAFVEFEFEESPE
jgi:hypothetical protein